MVRTRRGPDEPWRATAVASLRYRAGLNTIAEPSGWAAVPANRPLQRPVDIGAAYLKPDRSPLALSRIALVPIEEARVSRRRTALRARDATIRDVHKDTPHLHPGDVVRVAAQAAGRPSAPHDGSLPWPGIHGFSELEPGAGSIPCLGPRRRVVTPTYRAKRPQAASDCRWSSPQA